jgi:hypothetical protein
MVRLGGNSLPWPIASDGLMGYGDPGWKCTPGEERRAWRSPRPDDPTSSIAGVFNSTPALAQQVPNTVFEATLMTFCKGGSMSADDHVSTAVYPFRYLSNQAIVLPHASFAASCR